MTPSLREGDLYALGAAAGTLLALGLALAVGVVPLMAEGSARNGSELLSLLLLGLGSAAAVVLLLRVEPAWPFSLGIAAMIFSNNWANAGSPVPIDRVLIATGLLSLILRARSPRDVLGQKPSGVHLILICAALYAICSAVLVGSIGDSNARFALLDRYGILPFILFAVAPAAFPDAKSRRILLWTLTAVGAYLAYTSILGKIGPKSLVFPQYIVDPGIGIHADRARGPFVEAASDGLALFECGVAAAMLFATALDRRVRVVAAAIVLACGLSIVLTLTRSVWIGSAVAAVVTLLAARETRRYFAPVAVAGVLVVVSAFAVIPGLRGEANARTNDESPIWDRKNANRAAIEMVKEQPLVGLGWASFRDEVSGYIRLGDDYPVTRGDLAAHNVFLANAADLGLIGVTIWVAALAWAVGGPIVRRGPPELRLWKIGLLAIAAQWFVIAKFVPLGYAFPNALLWLWAGVAWGVSTAPQPNASRFEIAPKLTYSPAR